MKRLDAKDPQTLGPYSLVARLGSGGMGVVYLAAKGSDRVALKVVRGSFLDDPSLRSRFLREVSTLQKINHRNVAKVLDSDTDDDIAWLAMEYVNGADLKTIVEDKGPLSEARWFDLASGLLHALVAVHAEGVVHRDIKPANVLIEADQPKLIDFGISQISDETSVTATGLVAGSPAWLAPEQLEGGELSPAADMFSLGSVLVYAATGRSPWGEASTMTAPVIFNKILNSQPDLSGLTDSQRALVEPLLSSEPSHRPTAKKILGLIGANQTESGKVKEPEPQVVRKVKEPEPQVGRELGEVEGTNVSGPPPGRDTGSGSGSGRWKIAAVSFSLMVIVFVVWIFQLRSSDIPSPASEASGPSPIVSSGDITLKVGSLLPQTGELALRGQALQAGVFLAVQEINDSDAGVQIDLVWGDSGDVANREYESEVPRLVGSGVHAIIGPFDDNVAYEVIDEVTIESSVLLISPGAYSSFFSKNNGLFFRTVASDSEVIDTLADELVLDGRQTVGFLKSDYYSELGSDLRFALEAVGVQVVVDETFESGDTDFTVQVGQVARVGPDAVMVLASYEESTKIIPQLSEAGISGDSFYSGFYYDYGSDLNQGTLNGGKVVMTGESVWEYPPGFADRLNEAWAGIGTEPLVDHWFSAESYDAVISLALAAFAAQSTDSAAIAAKMSEVSGYNGQGTKCFSYLECVELISQGYVADYDGPSGGIAFGPNGNATEATATPYVYAEDNFVYYLER